MDKLIYVLTSEPVLAYPDFNKEFLVATDASMDGVGSVLCQKHGPEGQIRPVAFAGRSTSSTERRWSTTDLEALAVVYEVKKFHVYLQSKPFVIYTDHKALLSIF